jgi:ferredoxin
MNCLDPCQQGLIGYRTSISGTGEITSPDLSRRGFIVSLLSGAALLPMARLGGLTGPNWKATVVRPPGALAENELLQRCIKCGQCMRICPTNIVQPAGLEAGLEGLWTPVLDFRIGTSGCQLNCIACSHICPTAAIRPISLDEKLGRNEYAEVGPIRLGTAFVDRGRCLPWAMDTPCIVCQENCPVSPKAIFIREQYNTVRGGALSVLSVHQQTLRVEKGTLPPGKFATGDYFLGITDRHEPPPGRIIANSSNTLTLAPGEPWDHVVEAGSRVEIQVRLQRPYVDPKLCIGCGICEHECPVTGNRAIRVTAENESRSPERSLLLRST